jgi:D-alanyl-lipoteichoic acid acyltransferase DltB (MBOAT superfamily)
MAFTFFPFFLFIAISLVLFHAFNSYRFRCLVISIASAFFLSSFAKTPSEVMPFVLFLALGFFSVRLLHRYPSVSLLSVLLLAFIGLFLFLKKYSFVSFLPFINQPYMIVGMSYTFFRIVHLMVDVYGGAIREKISLQTFFNYTCFFLSFISGPIQRFEDFHEQARKVGETSLSQQECIEALFRIANGYLKILVVAEFFNYFYFKCYDKFFYGTGQASILFFFACLLLKPLYWYNDFSGLMDIVIGLGRLFGFRLPENFNKPFKSENYLEFWTRWHMTLSQWFKHYVFNPFLKILMYKWPGPKKATFFGIVAYFLTFFLVGIWHGSSWRWVIVAVSFGTGVSVNKFYQVVMRRILGRRVFASLRKIRAYRILCSGFAISYFTFCVSFVWLDFDEYYKVFNMSGPLSSIASGTGQFIFSFMCFVVGTCFILAVTRSVARVYSKSVLASFVRPEYPRLQQIVLGMKVSAILLVLFEATLVPSFVYMNF